MSDEQDLKLACLHHAGGDLDHAKALFEWVSGSVRATTDSEAPEVSAPDQDKPEEPFNYRHPSKFGTDIPRRCHLEELTPEERAIRDLVGTVESLGAHPLLTTTVIQLMKAGESLADWVDIELRDKAISALQSLSSGEGGVGLLDGEPEPVPTEVRTQDEQDAAGEDSVQIESGLAANLSKSNDELLRDIGVDPETGIYTATGIDIRIGAPQEAPAIPEGGEAKLGPRDPFLDSILERGGTWHDGGANPAPGWFMDIYVPRGSTNLGDQPNYLEGQPSNAYIWNGWEVAYVPTMKMGGDPDTTDKPLIVDETPTVPRSEIPEGSAVETFTDAGVETVKLSGLTHIVTDEPERTAETQPDAAYAPIHNEDEPVTNPIADDFAKGILMEAEAKAQEQKFSPFRLFGTLVGEGV